MGESRSSLFSFALQRKDIELAHLQAKLEDEQSLVVQLQKKLKEVQVSGTDPEHKLPRFGATAVNVCPSDSR